MSEIILLFIGGCAGYLLAGHLYAHEAVEQIRRVSDESYNEGLSRGRMEGGRKP